MAKLAELKLAAEPCGNILQVKTTTYQVGSVYYYPEDLTLTKMATTDNNPLIRKVFSQKWQKTRTHYYEA